MLSNPISWITSLPYTTQFSLVSLLQTSLHRNSSFEHPRSPHQCNKITKYHASAYSTSLLLLTLLTMTSWSPVSHPGLVSMALFSAGSVISLLPCQMWNRPVLLVHILLQCPPRLCLWSTTLRHVHHSSQYPHFLLFPKPSPLCRWHSALSFLPSDSLRL